MDASLNPTVWTPLLSAFGFSGMNALQMVMLVLAVVALAVLLLSTRGKLRARQQTPASTVRERYAELSGETSTRRDLEAVMLELDNLSRRVHGQLDTKFVKLETVIRDADERIERLTQLLQMAKSAPVCDVLIGAGTTGEPYSSVGSDLRENPHAAVYRMADAGETARAIAEAVDKPLGEIELILALRESASTAADAHRLSGSSTSPTQH